MVAGTVRYAWLTVAAAIATLILKAAAAYITGSVGILSDAMESTINLASSILLVVILKIAHAPPDMDHPWGHDKAEYFANGVQGTLILFAGGSIIFTAVNRFFDPRMLEAPGIGLGLAALAGVVNLVTARFLKARGKVLHSHAMKGEADHLMADVWTSIAVLVGVGLVYVTDTPWLDPLAALVVSVIILVTGARLVGKSISGLMDTAMPAPVLEKVVGVLESYREEHEIDYHALRTRVAGARSFVYVHILVPGAWSVKKGHDLLDDLEAEIAEHVPGVNVLTHLEPLEEPSSFQDMGVARAH